MRKIAKADIFAGKMSQKQFDAGRSLQQRMLSGDGRLVGNSMDAEAMAPKTWILWRDGPDMPNGSGKPTVEAELYTVPRMSDPTELVGMLVLMCPVCFLFHKDDAGQPYEHYLTVREDNKTVDVDWVELGKLKPEHHLRMNFVRDCRLKGIRPDPARKIPIVSSPERWQCDYCLAWCVKVTESIATTDISGSQVVGQIRGVVPAAIGPAAQKE